jgi:hypothetical protein
MASAGTRKICDSGSPITRISTRLSAPRWRRTSIGVPRAKCLIPRRGLPSFPRRLTRTFRASFASTTQIVVPDGLGDP